MSWGTIAIGRPQSAPMAATSLSKVMRKLIGADGQKTQDVYLYDRLTHSVERISVGVTHGSPLTALQNDFVVNGVTAGGRNQAAITATADGGFIAAYSTTDGSGTGIHAAIMITSATKGNLASIPILSAIRANPPSPALPMGGWWWCGPPRTAVPRSTDSFSIRPARLVASLINSRYGA